MDVSVKLTGHTTTAGLPTSGLALDAHIAKKGSLTVVHATALHSWPTSTVRFR